MASEIEFVAFTIVPVTVLGAMIAYSSHRVYKHNDKRPVVLIVLLALMALHQLTEIASFTSGTYFQTTSPMAESFETGANLLASIGSYFVLQQVTELRTTRNELEASNAALNERSSMVSVLNRILRHNVRNDVQVIADRAAHLQTIVSDDQVRRDLQTIEDTAWGLSRMSDRTQHIKQLLMDDPTSTTTLQLTECLEEPLERVRTGAPEATITLDGATDDGLVSTVPATFPIAVGDVVEQIVASNGGSVTVEVRVTLDQATDDTGANTVRIVIDDDGDGLPEADVQAIENEVETSLKHAKGLSLWCLDWTVKRADGDLDTDPADGTIEIRLPQASGEDVDRQ